MVGCLVGLWFGYGLLVGGWSTNKLNKPGMKLEVENILVLGYFVVCTILDYLFHSV